MKIIATAPTRLSLLGGGTDLPTYSSKYGGLVLNLAINLYQRVELSDTKPHSVNTPVGSKIDFYEAIFKEFDLDINSFNILCTFDGIIESGLGSSASAAVALIGSINKLKGLGMTREQIAEKAWDIEVNKIGLYGGKQDQYAAVFGGVNVLEFKTGGEVGGQQLTPQFINGVLPGIVLFYTGENRKSATIQDGFKILSAEQIGSLDNLKRLTIEAIDP